MLFKPSSNLSRLMFPDKRQDLHRSKLRAWGKQKTAAPHEERGLSPTYLLSVLRVPQLFELKEGPCRYLSRDHYTGGMPSNSMPNNRLSGARMYLRYQYRSRSGLRYFF